MEQASNDKKALIALMDLVLAIADYVTTPPGHRGNAIDRVRAERREVEGWRETLYLLGTEANRRALAQATGRPGILLASSDGQEAKAAVEATVRRWEAYAESRRELGRLSLKAYEALEADDSRVTDGHQCCGGKPDCGCRSVGG